MQDIYILLVNGSYIPEQIDAATNREAAIAAFQAQVDIDDKDDIQVLKSNPADNSAYFVTDDIAEAAWVAWDDERRDEPDAHIPAIYAKLKFKRVERYDDNREHAADYRARAI